MEQTDKVIKGLECCVNDDCRNCIELRNEFEQHDDCQKFKIREALSLIRSQQARIAGLETGQTARVMTKKLVENLIEGVPVWVEQRTEKRTYITPMISDGRGNIGCFSFGIRVQDVQSPDYRYWSARPTDEQREAVKWDAAD